MTTLIAEAGSSKIDWVLISSNLISGHKSSGINPLLASEEEIMSLFKEVKSELTKSIVPEAVFYYGAGCTTPLAANKIKNGLKNLWPQIEVDVQSDLLAAARSAFATDPGIICILGTGSNSGYYDGKNIIINIPPLGYILGDEGSGASLGKSLINAVFKKNLSQETLENFHSKYNYPMSWFLENIYGNRKANVFLASFVPYISENIASEDLRTLVKKEINDFFVKNLLHYPYLRDNEIRFIGSVAKQFEEIIRETGKDLNLKIGSVTASPLEGLIKYHMN